MSERLAHRDLCQHDDPPRSAAISSSRAAVCQCGLLCSAFGNAVT
jgi:hypothetical protein